MSRPGGSTSRRPCGHDVIGVGCIDARLVRSCGFHEIAGAPFVNNQWRQLAGGGAIGTRLYLTALADSVAANVAPPSTE
jgi:hypothetical protein